MRTLQLKYLDFQTLFTEKGLMQLDQLFLSFLNEADVALCETLRQYRVAKLTTPQISEFIIACAPILEKFIAELFKIEREVHAAQDTVHNIDDTLFQSIKKNEKIFHPIKKKNYANLVPMVSIENDPYARFEGVRETRREREGFQLTDSRMSLEEVLDEIHYCIYCHKNEGDFCSKGFPVKKNNPTLGFKINPANDLLTGCPLDEKISEMHVVKKSGFGIGALAIITIDNPFCALTGHRICNDCMKACIYQKQDPVNIPQIETRVLTDVLQLPWGVEIYDLLIRWNPLRQTQYLPKLYNHKKIAVMGMGPAGMTLSHHLLMEGCAVVGCDGLKIEPLPAHLLHNPIYDFNSIKESLDDRVMSGFGGVAEYGITTRWDKNFLKLIYLSLSRRPYFQVFGNVRFGGTMTIETAWQLGFDHVAITVGAGLPRELKIPNSLAPGMRQANDFLMALQLTGAAKKSSIANLQVRLPAIVIGGGLTGVDTATEVQAYYIVQVEKIHLRYHILKAQLGEDQLREKFDVHALKILDEFLLHAEKIIAERDIARRENRAPQLNKLIREWGGVTIAYRKSIQESPAYQRNHEELIKALEEGIYYTEGLEPVAVLLDQDGDANAITCRWRIQDETGNWIYSTEEQTLPAKSIFVATGAQPNVAYEFEHRGTFEREGSAYQCYDGEMQLIAPQTQHVKTDHIGIFTSYQNVKLTPKEEMRGKRVSFLGDTHPVFHGSVVKAIASAKRGYEKIMEVLNSVCASGNTYSEFRSTISRELQAEIISITKQNDFIVEMIVRAPLAAKQFCPGQFYRLQSYETTSHPTESIAALGIFDEKNPDQLSFFIIQRGASAKLLTKSQAGQPIALMGPTGAKIKIPHEPRHFLIVGNEMAIIYVLSIGSALKAAGHNITCIFSISEQNSFALARVKNITDHIIFCDTENNVVNAMQTLTLEKINDIAVIGDASLLTIIQSARNTALKNHLHPLVTFSASVYGSMQCMLKGVCAQCLQWQIDPTTGKRTKAVYACSWQHQPLEIVDINNIHERLEQNKTQEILASLWVDYLLSRENTVLQRA